MIPLTEDCLRETTSQRVDAAVSTGVDRGVDACINSPGAGVDTGVSTVPEQVLKRFNTTWNMC